MPGTVEDRDRLGHLRFGHSDTRMKLISCSISLTRSRWRTFCHMRSAVALRSGAAVSGRLVRPVTVHGRLHSLEQFARTKVFLVCQLCRGVHEERSQPRGEQTVLCLVVAQVRQGASAEHRPPSCLSRTPEVRVRVEGAAPRHRQTSTANLSPRTGPRSGSPRNGTVRCL